MWRVALEWRSLSTQEIHRILLENALLIHTWRVRPLYSGDQKHEKINSDAKQIHGTVRAVELLAYEGAAPIICVGKLSIFPHLSTII